MITPQEPTIKVKPLAIPACLNGTSSVAAFIQIPLNPEIQNPKMATTEAIAQNELLQEAA